MSAPAPLLPDGRALPAGRTLVMGILNVTPDSFSDGGLWDTPRAALEHAHAMLDEGADMIDVGGESTRPHSERIGAEREWRRIGEVVRTLAREGVVVSVDTLHAQTAARAARAGAAIINDVSGGLVDPRMTPTVADTACAFICQHWRGFPGSDEEDFRYRDVVGDVVAETSRQIEAAERAGIERSRIVFDPGLGFSLTPAQSWQLVGSVRRLVGGGYPVLVGASRKRFLALAPEGERDAATVAITRRCARAGVWAVRVHAVRANARAVRHSAEESA